MVGPEADIGATGAEMLGDACEIGGVGDGATGPTVCGRGWKLGLGDGVALFAGGAVVEAAI
jgi:hypothetical protein